MAIAATDRTRREPSYAATAARFLWGAIVGVASIVISPHRASLARLWNIPLTVSGTGCADYASFHLSGGWGWLVTGASLMFIEHLISDDGGTP